MGKIDSLPHYGSLTEHRVLVEHPASGVVSGKYDNARAIALAMLVKSGISHLYWVPVSDRLPSLCKDTKLDL